LSYAELTPGGAFVNAMRSGIHWISGYALRVKLLRDTETLLSLAVVSGITWDMNLTLIRGRGIEVYEGGVMLDGPTI
jgi:hypothetical protein